MEPWKAYDLRVMFQGFKERGFVAPEPEIERLTTLLGRQPRSYKDFAAATAAQWKAAWAERSRSHPLQSSPLPLADVLEKSR